MERNRGPAEAPNPGRPATPRPAASVVLLRRGGKHGERTLEVLMLKRADSAAFMPGVWVFPGGSVDAADGPEEDGRRVCAVRELSEEAGIDLTTDAELVLFSRWVTPEVVSTRFDAWFFLAVAPAHTPPQPDGVETIEAAWFAPAKALAAQQAGELRLAFPTIHQLSWLSDVATADEAIAAYRGKDVESVTPRIVREGDGHRVVLPGDPAYEEAEPAEKER